MRRRYLYRFVIFAVSFGGGGIFRSISIRSSPSFNPVIMIASRCHFGSRTKLQPLDHSHRPALKHHLAANRCLAHSLVRLTELISVSLNRPAPRCTRTVPCTVDFPTGQTPVSEYVNAQPCAERRNVTPQAHSTPPTGHSTQLQAECRHT